MIHETVIIVAGGWSVSQYKLGDLRERGFVIGVNDASTRARVHTAITMDRLWLEHRIETLEFLNVPVHYREGICKNVAPPRLGFAFKCNNKMDEPMTEEPGVLNGDNSGSVALNLAYKQGPRRVYLLGFDMQNGPNGEKHWYPDYDWANGGGTCPGKLQKWSGSFAQWSNQFVSEGIEVKNVNHRTALKTFAEISYKDFIKETT